MLLRPAPRTTYSVALLSLLLAACAATTPRSQGIGADRSLTPADESDLFAVANRLTWGASASELRQIESHGIGPYLHEQLHPTGADIVLTEVNAQIEAMSVVRTPVSALVQQMEQRRRDADATADDTQKKAAQQTYQQEMNRLARESASRHLLRAIYSRHQVQEEMTWFWMNHFSVNQSKSNLRAMLADYEETAVRRHALGKFRDLLGAVAHHPAMLRYLDNEQNAAGHINENYARELMELHTLGVDGGYSQHDVQELARVLTGVGVNLGTQDAKVHKELQPMYVRDGLFEFNPNRHDFGAKEFLGAPIRGRGLGELDDALDRLARHPSTARFISRKLASYWMTDDPPSKLVARMALVFQRSDGDIAQTLEALFDAPEFLQARSRKFKDPMHYVVSSVRLAYDDRPVQNVGPILNWLGRMGEPLYGRQTPDGYPLDQAAWASAGQMATRFEIARAIGAGNAGLFRPDGAPPQPQERPTLPLLATPLFYRAIETSLGAPTRAALAQAQSPQEWNTFLLSSPELMMH